MSANSSQPCSDNAEPRACGHVYTVETGGTFKRSLDMEGRRLTVAPISNGGCLSTDFWSLPQGRMKPSI